MNRIAFANPNHMPRGPIPRLFGRERESNVLRALLRRDDVRLVTLTGPGGIGKTRLAIQAAAELADTYANGVRFVSLADITNIDLVSTSIAHAIGIPEDAGAPIRDVLLTAFQDTEMLLVLDNFEHVLPAAPFLTELLNACPHIKLLVTSRSLLHLAGEHALPVPPLALPDTDDTSSPETVMQSPAVQLFADRAQAANPAFALVPETALIVADICRQLDGVPLAIELAASRITHLPLPTLRKRLDQRLPLLTGGPQDQPSRLQTMRDAIGWSHDLLSPEERAVFRRLSVFVGSFSLEAAEAVCSDLKPHHHIDTQSNTQTTSGSSEPFSVINVLDVIASLVNASLVQPATGPDGTARFWMLEVIREYAASQLAGSEDGRITQRAHATWFLELAEEYHPNPYLPAEKLWLVHLDTDIANLREALSWLERQDDPADFLRLVSLLSWFWFIHGYIHDGRHWLATALERGSDMTADRRARIIMMLGLVRLMQGQREIAAELANEALTRAEYSGDVLISAQAHITCGVIESGGGAYGPAKTHLQRAIELAQSLPDPRQAASIESSAVANLGVVARGEGRFEEATALHERALVQQRAIGSIRAELLSLGDLADVARDQGDTERASSYYRQGMVLAHEHREQRAVADALDGLASTAIASGDAHRATRLYAAAEQFRKKRTITIWIVADAKSRQQGLDAARARLGEEAFAAAWAAGLALSLDQAIHEAMNDAAALPTSPYGDLTPREDEVLRSLVAGLTDRQIAADLFLSVRTVEHHVARILTKLGVKTRTAAATVATAAGLVPPVPPATP